MTRSSILVSCTALVLLACGKGEPPLPRLASETLTFGLNPTHDEIPRDLRVTLDVPADWARTATSSLKTFSSGDAEGTIYGKMSVELALLHADDPAEVPTLLANRLEAARQEYGVRQQDVRTPPGATPGMTIYELERGTLRRRLVVRVVSPEHGFVLFCGVEASSGYSAVFGDRLLEACKTAKLELAVTTLPADVLAAERAKLAQCPPATNVVFTRSEHGLALTGFGPVLAGRAFATSGGKLEIDLANYKHDDWQAAPKPTEEGQVRLAFEVFPAVDKAVISGRYPVGKHGFEASSRARLLSTGEWTMLELAVEDENRVDIVARTADKVCGSFIFSDGRHTLRGTFALDLVVGRAVR